MTVTFSLWTVPVALTVLIWTAAIAWPIRSSRGDYDFGPAFAALIHLAVAFVGTLLVWLVFLAIMLWIA